MTTYGSNSKPVQFGEVDVSTDDPFVEVKKKTAAYAKDSTLLLFDARHAVYRAIHTREGLTSPDGKDTRGLHGFLEIVATVCGIFRTNRFLVVWDGGVENKRAFHPAYKSRQDRPSTDEEIQLAEMTRAAMRVAREGSDRIGIPSLHHPNFEADDLIGLAAYSRAVQDVDRVVVVSDDKDFLQLVDSHVLVWRGVSKRLVGLPEFNEEYPFPPERFVDFKALVGEPETGDNIPGVPGFGVKTAMKYIGSHGDLESAIKFAVSAASVSKPKPHTVDINLSTHIDDAMLSYKLSKIATEQDDLREWTGSEEAEKVASLVSSRVDSVCSDRCRKRFSEAVKILRGEYGFAIETCENVLRPMGYL